MKILFLTSRLPYPPYRGDKLKIWNLITQLSRNHKIFLVTFIQHRSEEQWLPIVEEKCVEVHTVYKPLWSSLLSCAKAILPSTPFQVAYFESVAMNRLVVRLMSQIEPDIVHTHLIRMAQYSRSISSIPKVLDMTDAVSLYLGRFRDSQKNPFLRRLIDLEYERVISYESVIKQYDRSLVCSELDRAFLTDRLDGVRIDMLENGVDLETFYNRDVPSYEPYRIIFTGNMDYYPNADAASFFVDEIFPLIKQNVPEAKLFIVGQNPPRRVRSLASADVIVTGFVENIQREYLKSAVAVSPVRFGAGTLNKILEPLALGVPVVATSTGTEGLHLEDGKEILIANDPAKFADAVCRILGDPDFRQQIAGSARDKVRSQWGWEKIAERLENIYQEVLSESLVKQGLQDLH